MCSIPGNPLLHNQQNSICNHSSAWLCLAQNLSACCSMTSDSSITATPASALRHDVVTGKVLTWGALCAGLHSQVNAILCMPTAWWSRIVQKWTICNIPGQVDSPLQRCIHQQRTARCTFKLSPALLSGLGLPQGITTGLYMLS